MSTATEMGDLRPAAAVAAAALDDADLHDLMAPLEMHHALLLACLHWHWEVAPHFVVAVSAVPGLILCLPLLPAWKWPEMAERNAKVDLRASQST